MSKMSNKNRILEPGWTTTAQYVRAIDGDTIQFKIERTFNVRLRDIDVIEKNEEGGLAATEFVDNLMSDAKEILVFIPTNDPTKLIDIVSFERVVGDVYVDNTHLNELLRSSGYEKKSLERVSKVKYVERSDCGQNSVVDIDK